MKNCSPICNRVSKSALGTAAVHCAAELKRWKDVLSWGQPSRLPLGRQQLWRTQYLPPSWGGGTPGNPMWRHLHAQHLQGAEEEQYPRQQELTSAGPQTWVFSGHRGSGTVPTALNSEHLSNREQQKDRVPLQTTNTPSSSGDWLHRGDSASEGVSDCWGGFTTYQTHPLPGETQPCLSWQRVTNFCFSQASGWCSEAGMVSLSQPDPVSVLLVTQEEHPSWEHKWSLRISCWQSSDHVGQGQEAGSQDCIRHREWGKHPFKGLPL